MDDHILYQNQDMSKEKKKSSGVLLKNKKKRGGKREINQMVAGREIYPINIDIYADNTMPGLIP